MNELKEMFQEICSRYKLYPQKRFGQNFLIDDDIYSKIVDCGEITKDEVVLEVGPGLGELTKRLARKAKKVIAVEFDVNVGPALSAILKSNEVDNVEIRNEDILLLDKDLEYDKIIANLPYNISAKFLSQYLSERKRPKVMVLMLQKEVVERVCAEPGKMSILGVSVQFYAQTEYIDKVRADMFWPSPKVDSAIIRIKPKSELPDLRGKTEKEFFQLVRIGFSSKRKMLKNNLCAGFQWKESVALERLASVGLKETVRAQELSVEQWIDLLGTF